PVHWSVQRIALRRSDSREYDRSLLTKEAQHIYQNRKMVEGYPGLADQALETYRAVVEARPEGAPHIEMILAYLDRLIDVRKARKFLVVGCGPEPEALRVLRQMGYDVVGVEPVRQ